jgi:hypothetical protein
VVTIVALAVLLFRILLRLHVFHCYIYVVTKLLCFHSSAWVNICSDYSPIVFTVLSWLKLFCDRYCYIYIYVVVTFCCDLGSVVFTILWRLKFYRICKRLQVSFFDIFYVAPACHFASLHFTSLSLHQDRSEQSNLASFRAGHDSRSVLGNKIETKSLFRWCWY